MTNIEHTVTVALDKDACCTVELQVEPIRSCNVKPTELLLIHMIPTTASLSHTLLHLLEVEEMIPPNLYLELKTNEKSNASHDKSLATTLANNELQIVSDMDDDTVISMERLQTRYSNKTEEKNLYEEEHVLEHESESKSLNHDKISTITQRKANIIKFVRVCYVTVEIQAYALLVECTSSTAAEALRNAMMHEQNGPSIKTPIEFVHSRCRVFLQCDIDKNEQKQKEDNLNIDINNTNVSIDKGKVKQLEHYAIITSILRSVITNCWRDICEYNLQLLPSHVVLPTNTWCESSQQSFQTSHKEKEEHEEEHREEEHREEEHYVRQTSNLRLTGKPSTKESTKTTPTLAACNITNNVNTKHNNNSSFTVTYTNLTHHDLEFVRESVSEENKTIMLPFRPYAEDEPCAICLYEPLREKPCMMTLCQHTFHLKCYARLPRASAYCPLCRFSLYDLLTSVRCEVCRTFEDLWVCLICGFVGCGGGRRKHAQTHREETGHSTMLQCSTNRIWNNTSRMFLHQEVALLLDQDGNESNSKSGSDEHNNNNNNNNNINNKSEKKSNNNEHEKEFEQNDDRSNNHNINVNDTNNSNSVTISKPRKSSWLWWNAHVDSVEDEEEIEIQTALSESTEDAVRTYYVNTLRSLVEEQQRYFDNIRAKYHHQEEQEQLQQEQQSRREEQQLISQECIKTFTQEDKHHVNYNASAIPCYTIEPQLAYDSKDDNNNSNKNNNYGSRKPIEEILRKEEQSRLALTQKYVQEMRCIITIDNLELRSLIKRQRARHETLQEEVLLKSHHNTGLQQELATQRQRLVELQNRANEQNNEAKRREAELQQKVNELLKKL